MTLYKMCEWERSDHYDTDWYAVVYDTEKDELCRVITGTTRYASPLNPSPELLSPTEEIMEKAKAANLKLMLPILKNLEYQRVMNPYSDLQTGLVIKTLDSFKVMEKENGPCIKCNGTGAWINPKNLDDRRTCFSCSGTGIVISKNKVKDERGKQKYAYIPANYCGEIMDIKVWGTFYSNGYNRPCRDNTRALIKFQDGNCYWISCNHIRLKDDMMSDEDLIRRWQENGGDTNFYTYFKYNV